MNNKKLKKQISILVLLLGTIICFSIMLHNGGKGKPYDCKVLEVYFEDAGYKVSAKYKAVVYIIDLKKTTSINLRPEGYYKASNYKKTGETVGYYFNNIELERINGGFGNDIAAIFFSILLVSFFGVLISYMDEYGDNDE